MTTLQHHRRITRPTLRTVLAAGLIIVVAVGALLLTLNRTNHTQTAPTTHTQTPSPYLPTIQTHGAGIAHVVVDPRTGQAHGTVAPPTRGSEPSGPCMETCNWEKIKIAARLRDMALAPRRTAHFRAFAADLGLRELVSLHPAGPGRCATAVSYLYNNLLDLNNAYPGENWNPLRRAVANEPSIHACAPRPADQHAA